MSFYQYGLELVEGEVASTRGKGSELRALSRNRNDILIGRLLPGAYVRVGHLETGLNTTSPRRIQLMPTPARAARRLRSIRRPHRRIAEANTRQMPSESLPQHRISDRNEEVRRALTLNLDSYS
jgi:hypothetical protein